MNLAIVCVLFFDRLIQLTKLFTVTKCKGFWDKHILGVRDLAKNLAFANRSVGFLVGMHGSKEPKHGTENSREHYEQGNDQPIWIPVHNNLIFVL
jgi:hypothetical protein